MSVNWANENGKFMKRRDFLKTGTLAAAAAVSGIDAVAIASDSLTTPSTVLSKHDNETLLKMARQIFPHDRLDDSCYAPTIAELNNDAAKDPAVAKLLRDGVTNLDKVQDAKFVSLTPDDQVAALRKIEHTPFFQKVQSVELVALYNNHAVWKQLGYPGPSYQIGGYIHHGFNDIAWLPDPPESASPKLA
jgi:hypothetical protein